MNESNKSTFKAVLHIGGICIAASILGMLLLFYSQSVVEYQQESDSEKLCGLLERSSIELELRIVEDANTNELLVIDCDEYAD